jgi:hypothetical protein
MKLYSEKGKYDLDIRFVLQKGEGEWPKLSQLSADERIALRRLAIFYLDWDYELADGLEDDIHGIEVLYDGVTPLLLPSERLGLHIVEDAIVGFPSPIFRFKFSKRVDPDHFTKIVWMSQMVLQCHASVGIDEPFCCEDHQGYTGIVDPILLTEITDTLRKMSAPLNCTVSLSTLLSGLKLADI